MSREEGHGSDDSKGDPNPQIPKTNSSHKELKISKKNEKGDEIAFAGPAQDIHEKKRKKRS